jgi:hypothetical protein
MTHFCEAHSIVLERNHADRYTCLSHYTVVSQGRTPRKVHSELPGLMFGQGLEVNRT